MKQMDSKKEERAETGGGVNHVHNAPTVINYHVGIPLYKDVAGMSPERRSDVQRSHLDMSTVRVLARVRDARKKISK